MNSPEFCRHGRPALHAAVPHLLARPVSWVMTYATRAASVENVWGCSWNMSWHWVRKDLQPPGEPSYLSGAGRRGSRTPVSAARSGLPPGPAHSGTGVPRAAELPGRRWTVWRPGGKWSACTASPPAVAAVGSPTEHPAVPSFCCSWDWSTGSVVVRAYCYGRSTEPEADQGIFRVVKRFI